MFSSFVASDKKFLANSLSSFQMRKQRQDEEKGAMVCLLCFPYMNIHDISDHILHEN